MSRISRRNRARVASFATALLLGAGGVSATELALPHKCDLSYMCMNFTPAFSQYQRTRAIPFSFDPGNIAQFEDQTLQATLEPESADDVLQLTTEANSFGFIYKVRTDPFCAKIEVYYSGELRGSYDANCGLN